jgi:hypothetical protein
LLDLLSQLGHLSFKFGDIGTLAFAATLLVLSDALKLLRLSRVSDASR